MAAVHSPTGSARPPSISCPPSASPWQLTLLRGSPLDAYATFLQRWDQKKGPLWAHLGLSLLLNTLVAVFITLCMMAFSGGSAWPIFTTVLPISQWIGISIMGLFALSGWVIGTQRLIDMHPVVTFLYYLSGSLGGVVVGIAGSLMLRRGTLSIGSDFFRDPSVWGSLGIGVCVSFIAYQIVSARTKAANAIAFATHEQTRTLAAEKAAAEAKLNMLQAQIEPHFLFNTLANVSGLIESQPVVARVMLENFIHYLRASLSVTRQSTTSIQSEIDLLRSYLSILQVRMGERLQYTIDVDDGIAALQVVPMLFQPIVENAIEHGLEPALDGGTVEIRFRKAADGAIAISITDTGVGFIAETSGGIGLSNVRERLLLAHGQEATLTITANSPQGTCVTIMIPAR